jgi:hypothetical protein
MTNTEFCKVAVNAVVDYFNSKKEKTDQYVMTEDDVYIVWLCKTLQNHKAMLSTMVSDGMYYEFTWNGDKNEGYLDAYKKWENVVIKGKGGENEK